MNSCVNRDFVIYVDEAIVSVEVNTNSKINEVETRAFSETAINDIYVMIYNSDGKLTGSAFGSTNPIVVNALSGDNCRVLAVTNFGITSIFSGSNVSELSSLLNLTTDRISTLSDIQTGDNLEMSGNMLTNISPGSSSISAGDFFVSRFVAKNDIIVTCEDGIELTGYTIKSIPAKSWLIAHPNTNESTVNDAVVGNDAVSTSNNADWINTGLISATGESPYNISFYMYENRRGGRVEVGGTTGDPSTETPAEKPVNKALYAPERATYVELYVSKDGSLATYKLYLGADNNSNYNIKRNCNYKYNVLVSAYGIVTVNNVIINGWTNINGGSEGVN